MVFLDVPGIHKGTRALPFCHLTLRGPKPLDPSYPTETTTLGEHLRKRRMDLGLSQRQVAGSLGANPWTYLLWEHDRTVPTARFVSLIVEFLGYDPSPKGEIFQDRLRASRRRLGLSQRGLARRLGVDVSTVQKWESGRHIPPVRYWPAILRVIGHEELPPDAPLADRIRAFRRAHGLTQARLGVSLGVSQSVISEWERSRGLKAGLRNQG
jgi:transcriptional regulator with XRE-family HTH domain